jgi:predicted CXXCH cytochrome family protein
MRGIQLTPQGHSFQYPLEGYKFRLRRQAAQRSFIPQGYKFRLRRQAAQLSFNLISQLLLLSLWLPLVMLPGRGAAGAETAGSQNDCLQCHNELWAQASAKRYIHAPFLEKQCTGCHAADTPFDINDPGLPDAENEAREWLGKSLAPATSHWFSFAAGTTPAIMVLEASYGSMVRLYREIPLPPLTELTNIADTYGPDPPRISRVKVLEVKKDIFLTASISWRTDRPTGAMITYGVQELHQTTPLNGRLQTEHLETLTSLKPGQTYRFKISAEDAVGNKSESDIFTFSTAATFENPAEKPRPAECCSAVPLGLESHFFRNGDLYLINITCARPVKIFFTLKNGAKVDSEPTDGAETIEPQPPQVTRHIITTEEESVTFIICKGCHQNLAGHHPVNVYPKRGMVIPADYPTLADGRISCVTCHDPHAANLNYLMRKDYQQELCVGCHQSFRPTG